MGCLGFLSEFIFEVVLDGCISISVFSFRGNKKRQIDFCFLSFYLPEFWYREKIAVWVAKKPDIIGLFAGDIFFVPTLWLLRTIMMPPCFL